jgi:putative sporulation protein YyaC
MSHFEKIKTIKYAIYRDFTKGDEKMVALDEKIGGVQIGKFTSHEELANAFSKYIKLDLNDVVFLCIGTDRSTGDSYAPMVGTLLQESGYENVIGTIDDPVHAVNLDERIKEIPEDKVVIALDASLGKLKSVGNIILNKGKLYPGAGVGKELTPVGDYSIHAIVNISGFQEFIVLQNTRLSVVMKLAKETVNAVKVAFPVKNEITTNNVIEFVM